MGHDSTTSVRAAPEKALWKQHWFCIVPLLPALTLIGLHKALGLSDSVLGRRLGEDLSDGPVLLNWLFNLLIVAVFYLGVAAYLAHATILAQRSYALFVLKLGLLAIGWYVLLVTLDH